MTNDMNIMDITIFYLLGDIIIVFAFHNSDFRLSLCKGPFYEKHNSSHTFSEFTLEIEVSRSCLC